MLRKDTFGSFITCMADGQTDSFTDGYVLDTTYLGRFRPRLLTIQFMLRLTIHARVESDPASPDEEMVVLKTKYGETRVPRSKLGAQWKREESELVHLILKFTDVRPGLTDRDCIWIQPADPIPIVHFKVYPRQFERNESIDELVVEAKKCVIAQLLSIVEPA